MPHNRGQRNEDLSEQNRPKGESDSWKDGFLAAIGREDFSEAILVLDSQKTSHAGTPRQAIKLQAAKMMGSQYGESSAALYSAAKEFANSESEGAQEVGLVLIGQLYGHNPPEVAETVLLLADSENWEVREWAASALRRIVSGNFTAILPTIRAWSEHRSANVRRAVVVACGSAAGSCTDEECRQMLDILTPLLEDDDPYVRKNLGAFAIGDSFLKAQPGQVAEWLGRASSHPRAQWNVAMALSAAEAAKHFELLSDLLWKLATDDRNVVRRATYRAVLNLAKRIPEKIYPLLEEWKEDTQRTHVHSHVESKLS